MTGDGHMRQLIYPMKEQYEEFLIDESKFSGYADSISFPESAEEMQEVLQELKKERVPVTIQGGKTGITGAGIPRGGHVMNLSHMNKVKDSVLLEDGTGNGADGDGGNGAEAGSANGSCTGTEAGSGEAGA